LTEALEQIMMTPAISNEEKVGAAWDEYSYARAIDDRKEIEKKKDAYLKAGREHDTLQKSIQFLKAALDQNEIRQGLTPERKLALAKLKELESNKRSSKDYIAPSDPRGATLPDGTLLKKPAFTFDEDGGYTVHRLNIGPDPDSAEPFMAKFPEGMKKAEHVSVGEFTLDLVPKRMENLALRVYPSTTLHEAESKALRVRAFLRQEHEITNHVDFGHYETQGPSFDDLAVNEILKGIKDSDIKLKIGKDNGYHWVSGGTPLAERIQKLYPYHEE
ncbi:MAG TPA: hypothetical protein VMU11_00940, partial [Verrucomicrobiae bacterium]|nr:hypothetical protein [Verrucomicrobiae bacterium]